MKIESPARLPLHLTTGDNCYHLMEYTARGGYNSPSNQLIANFKKGVDRKGKSEWVFKERAVEVFARNLNELLIDGDHCVCAIPTSKARTDAAYDSRLDDVLQRLREMNPRIRIERPIEVKTSHLASHLGGTRDIDSVYENFEWRGFQEVPRIVILVDDVITMGTHYKACEKMILEHHPEVAVFGVFWAKCIWEDPKA